MEKLPQSIAAQRFSASFSSLVRGDAAKALLLQKCSLLSTENWVTECSVFSHESTCFLAVHQHRALCVDVYISITIFCFYAGFCARDDFARNFALLSFLFWYALFIDAVFFVLRWLYCFLRASN